MNVRLLAAVFVMGCTPTLTPVVDRQPLLAWNNPPQIIWLFDQSGSMYVPVNPSSPTCPAGCGTASNACPPTCLTREDVFRTGIDIMASLLPESVANIPVKFPVDSLCGSPGDQGGFPAGPRPASELHALLAGYYPTGGTPTASALRYAASAPPVVHAETIVVLVTDGLPNCNDANPYNLCTQPTDQAAIAACRCTTVNCTNALCAKGCLDDLGPVSASHLLAERGMKLLVIGLGSDIATGSGPSVLGSMEISLPALCSSSADCHGGACNPDGVCADKVFLALTSAEFAAPGQRLARAVQVSDRCTWWLPRQVAASDLTVEIGNDVLDPSEWTLKGEQEQRVVISGAACDRLIAGTESVSFSLPPAN